MLDERARNKRKLQEMEAEDESDGSAQDDASDVSGIEREQPGQGLKKQKLLDEEEDDDAATPKTTKKQKVLEEPAEDKTAANKKQTDKEDKRSAKKERKEEAKKLKKEGKGKKAETKPDPVEDDAEESATEDAPVQPSTEADSDEDPELAPIDVSGLDDKEVSTVDSTPNSPVFDAAAEPASTTTSISSAVPPSEKPKYLKLPADTTALRARLEAKLVAMRAARKVDDADGTPIRTRQDLIESRRKKQAQRKANKKEMREKAREEEDRKREEALNSARNSPGLSPLFEKDDGSANNFAFGRLAFSDGTQLSHDLSYEKAAAGVKKKGPSDPKTALAKIEAQKKRIAGMGDDKRKEVLEKETWLAARKRTEGDKVHDSESLLKKALKRKEKAKKKSEHEWTERAEGVKKAIHDRQRKREDNLKKRRDDKLAHKTGKKKNKGVATKKKSRPGFEGGFGGGGKK